MLDGPPKRQFASQTHQRVLCMRQQMSIRHLQFLIQGEKTASTLWTRTYVRSTSTFGLHASATSVAPAPSLMGLPTLLAHQFLAGFTLGCRTRFRRLLDHSGAQTIDLLIDGLLYLGEGRFRVALLSTGRQQQRLPLLFFPTLVSLRVAS